MKKYRVIRLKPVAVIVIGLLACACIGIAGGILRAAPAWSPNAKHPVYSVETENPHVSLGINCAWGNEDIPQLLSVLDSYHIKATFFIVGEWCDKFPESVKQISEAGHEIGSHSDTHADMTRLDDAGVLREIRASREKLERVSGKAVTLFRTPSGAYNDRVVTLIEQEGMIPVQWDLDSIDYKDPSPETMRERILKNLKNGSIMLFHSGAKNTPRALPMVIEAVTEKGYRFVGVSELVHEPPYAVDYTGRQHKAEKSAKE
ncbi:MAG: polysaccharide deacetylase family protein [Oscillospiraceae bacterium]|nr:polysaccharide deacetylase family protein [Oscillospiraceae bacterium]